MSPMGSFSGPGVFAAHQDAGWPFNIFDLPLPGVCVHEEKTKCMQILYHVDFLKNIFTAETLYLASTAVFFVHVQQPLKELHRKQF